MVTKEMNNIIKEEIIEQILDQSHSPSADELQTVLEKAKKLQRLSVSEVATLLNTSSAEGISLIKETAGQIKNDIYGNRLVFFAPMYVSNYCGNDCQYCAFRKDNEIVRTFLTKEQIQNETQELLKQGHKRVLLVAGEAYPPGKGLDFILEAIDTIYAEELNKSKIRRINVNIAPLSVEDFKKLKDRDIGTYQLFQETYHRKTYSEVHLSGSKSDYDKRIEAIDNAFDAGIDDIGIGVLFGLYDWKFEVLALMQHVEHLEEKYGMGPHTISVPRMEPAQGLAGEFQVKHELSDEEFARLIAILRLAVPYTGIILSTRENPETRRSVLNLGVSQISAGSRTNPGGYKEEKSLEQFSLGDHRSLDEVVYDICQNGYIPSFCTSCYRLGRTGLDFMEYAKPGDIKKKCFPNALITFKEYLLDFASEKTRELGDKIIEEQLKSMPDTLREKTEKFLTKIEKNKRDLFL